MMSAKSSWRRRTTRAWNAAREIVSTEPSATTKEWPSRLTRLTPVRDEVRRRIVELPSTTKGRNVRECGAIGVMAIVSRVGCIIGPPALRL